MKNRTRILEALAFLMFVNAQIDSAFSKELKTLIDNENVSLKKHTMYIRKNITGGANNVDLIDENTAKINGVSTISKTSLRKNEAVIFDRVSVALIEADGENKEGAVDYSADGVVPGSFRNANLVIVQNTREVLDVPVADLLRGEVTSGPEGSYCDLEGFQYLNDEESMEIFFRMPNGEILAPSAAGKNWYVEFRANGWKTTKKQ